MMIILEIAHVHGCVASSLQSKPRAMEKLYV